VNRRIDPDSGKIYDISDGGDLPEGVDAATLVQRSDDQEDKVQARLDAFAKERDAVCSVFNDIVHTVDGNQCVLRSAKSLVYSAIIVHVCRATALARNPHKLRSRVCCT
jgi:adenylate kinase family enzyme